MTELGSKYKLGDTKYGFTETKYFSIEKFEQDAAKKVEEVMRGPSIIAAVEAIEKANG